MPPVTLMQPQIQQNERCTSPNHTNSTSSRIAIDSLLNHSLSTTEPSSSTSSRPSMQSLLHPSSTTQSLCSPLSSSLTPPFYPSPISHNDQTNILPTPHTHTSKSPLSSVTNPNDNSISSTLPFTNITHISSQQVTKPPISPQALIVKTSNGKRHRCTYTGCGRDFTRLSNLKAHWRRHSGEEPYACTHCARKFKWRSSLKSHELGCVFEFTKRNSHLKWVYLTPQGNFPASTMRQTNEQLQQVHQDQPSQFWASSQSNTNIFPNKGYNTIDANQYEQQPQQHQQSSVNAATQPSQLMERPFSANRHSF